MPQNVIKSGMLKMKKFILLLLSLCLLLSSCGLPGADDLEDLDAPSGLEKKGEGETGVVCSAGIATGFELSFWGFNSEYDFSGYNIYVIRLENGSDSLTQIQSYLQNQVMSHKSSKDTVERTYIIRYGENESWPTLNKDYLGAFYSNYASQPTPITVTIQKDWAPWDMVASVRENFDEDTYYGFGVTAYAASSVSTGGQDETLISNAVMVYFSSSVCP